ncbi:MAG: nuclear transport factor 2 family protein [Bdellovibrionales bacterium]|nr:nuclear transport factor 2 family protein [Bdellovibrionales bacterium]
MTELPTAEEILLHEKQIWDALIAGDPAADAELLSDDFLGVYPTGYSSKFEHSRQLESGPVASSYELTEVRFVALARDKALLVYRAQWSRFRNGRALPQEEMFVSSIWEKREENWLNIFSQDTPYEEEREV